MMRLESSRHDTIVMDAMVVGSSTGVGLLLLCPVVARCGGDWKRIIGIFVKRLFEVGK